jgi:hypothetical protein
MACGQRRLSDIHPIPRPREQLRRYDMHYVFLQAALQLVEFRDFFPASIFVFETQAPEDRQLQFDFADNYLSLAISVRVGRVGILRDITRRRRPLRAAGDPRGAPS